MRYLVILSGVVCLVFMLLPACAPAPEPVGEEAPSIEADVAAIRKVADDFMVALNACDVEAMLALCADDELVMPPNEPAIVGRRAIESLLRNWCDAFDIEESIESMQTQIAGDWAFASFTSRWTLIPKAGGDPGKDELKGLWVFKRQSDGAWKFTHAIWNSDNPLPGEPTT